MQEIEKILEEIEQEHPYHIPGRPETYSEYNDGWTDAIDRVRAELSKKLEELKPYEDTGITPEQIKKLKEENDWIPVEERLPEENGFYIATMDGKIVGQEEPFVGLAEFEDGKWIDDEDDYKCVIAWRPLPEPYQPERRI